jgi:hypothetical protein
MKLQAHGLAAGLLGVLLVVEPGRARGQQPPPAARPATLRPAAPRVVPHRFWDRTNLELFAGVAAVRALDFASTRHFRARGVNEALLSNSIVDNKPAFAAIEVAGVAASIGVSYWLHRTGHHRLERWVSIIHIGVAGFGDARNFTLGKSPPAP